MTPNPPPPAAPKKSGSSGCLVALAVIGGLLLVMCLIGGIFAWRASKNPETKKIFSAMGKGVQMATKGMNAPGTAELRAAGCKQALVIAPEDISEMVEIFVDGGLTEEGMGGPLVMCQGTLVDNLPDCDALALVYVQAAHPRTTFSVTVRVQGKSKDTCARQYDAAGTPTGPRQFK